jgi:holo-[acyl-carrier protein] synthase
VATVGVGIDLVDVERFAALLARRPGVLERLFTEVERRDAGARPERLAARFAAKEAVLKSLSVGVGAAPWRAIEVRRDPSGAPRLALSGAAAELAARRGVGAWHVSLTHTATSAGAVVVASAPGGDVDAR